ncbi:MAG: glycosyl transferase [Denitrovibrio sp.]|nr:MAG: glycosyl transferase [Denitrovibrio sp.]
MKLSVIIPVYNEQENINSTISHIRKFGDCEIVVSDHNGETNKIIKDKDVIQVISPKGRASQLNNGALNSTGDLLLFLHADSILSKKFITEIENSLENYDVGAFKLEINDEMFMFRIIERVVSLRNKITKIPYGDQGIFCTRKVFYEIGHYENIPIMEDVQFMQKCKKNGLKLFLSNLPLKTSSRRWKKEGFLYTNLRNWTIISLYYLGIKPSFLKKFYK